MTTLTQRVSDELLPFVQQPGQYIGGEINQLVQRGDWDCAQLRIALAFPDSYAIGMSHLGSQILYAMCNRIPGVCCERVYVPWIDAEQVMRDKQIPLFTWDTRRYVRDADILAISLQYELTFTNLLTLFDLAGIPFRSSERDDSHPLVIAGGPQADNPEPVADFLDAVILGDGEDSLAALAEVCREMKLAHASRDDILKELAARFDWVYVPRYYAFDYYADGTIAACRRSEHCPDDLELPLPVYRCQCGDFENLPVPLKPLLPYTEIVHDRIGIEIMRGCPNRCRFCHAGYTKKPVRIRSPQRIIDIAEHNWRNTGHHEISLLSLSTANYPQLAELADRLNQRFRDRRVSLSIPSLRVDKLLSDVPQMVSAVRKTGLTIAIEAAHPRVREALRKKVLAVDLMEGVKQAYAAGWNSLKLYFMCGLPGETQEDIAGIFDLAHQISQAKRYVRGGPAAVTASVGWLVPKPHTPLQWSAQQTLDYFTEADRLLRSTARERRTAARVRTHKPQRSILEGVFARGDRRLAPVIEAAYRLGARMDGWEETFDYSLWLRAFEETGTDPAFYAHRERSLDEILPWDHLLSGPDKNVLQREYADLLEKIDAPRD